MGPRSLPKTAEKKFLQPTCSGCFLCASAHLSVRPSVHPSIRLEYEKSRFLTCELKLGYQRGVICPSSVPSKYLFLHAISCIYCTPSKEVKPITISCHNQKSDTRAQPEKTFLQPGAASLNTLCKISFSAQNDTHQSFGS
jgi:hypothetical protein